MKLFIMTGIVLIIYLVIMVRKYHKEDIEDKQANEDYKNFREARKRMGLK